MLECALLLYLRHKESFSEYYEVIKYDRARSNLLMPKGLYHKIDHTWTYSITSWYIKNGSLKLILIYFSSIDKYEIVIDEIYHYWTIHYKIDVDDMSVIADKNNGKCTCKYSDIIAENLKINKLRFKKEEVCKHVLTVFLCSILMSMN